MKASRANIYRTLPIDVPADYVFDLFIASDQVVNMPTLPIELLHKHISLFLNSVISSKPIKVTSRISHRGVGVTA